VQRAVASAFEAYAKKLMTHSVRGQSWTTSKFRFAVMSGTPCALRAYLLACNEPVYFCYADGECDWYPEGCECVQCPAP
jgi:hypothetical protein